jgi:serine/threonine protein kinase
MSQDIDLKNFLDLPIDYIVKNRNNIVKKLKSEDMEEKLSFIVYLASSFIILREAGTLRKFKNKIGLGLDIAYMADIPLPYLYDKDLIWDNSKTLRTHFGEGEKGIHPEDYPTSYIITEYHNEFLDTYPIIGKQKEPEEPILNTDKKDIHKELKEREKYGEKTPDSKTIITNKNGKIEKYYITPADISPGGMIEKMGIVITDTGLRLLRGSANIFYLVGTSNHGIYTLQPTKQVPKHIDTKVFSIQSEKPIIVGRGTYGEVSALPENIIQKVSLGVKKFSQDMIMEVSMYNYLEKLSCIPHIYGLDIDNNFSFYIQKGVENLKEKIKRRVSYNNAILIMFRLSKCMRSIAGQGVMHLDLKPQNIIVDVKDKVQIIDWGLAEIDTRRYDFREKNPNKQTLWYRSPEICAEIEQYSIPVDIYSMGLIFLEILLGEPAMATLNSGQHCVQILRLSGFTEFSYTENRFFENNREIDIISRYREIYNRVNYSTRDKTIQRIRDKFGFAKRELLDFLAGMLEFKPEFRTKWNDIIIHPIFQNIKRESIPRYNMLINNMPIVDNIKNVWNAKTENRHMKGSYRKGVINWLWDVYNILIKANFFKNIPQIFESSVQLMDLCILKDKFKINKENAQIVASVCLGLSINLYETSLSSENIDNEIAGIGQLNYIDIIEMKKNILYSFEGNIIIPTYTSYSYFVEKEPVNSLINYLRDDIYNKPFITQITGERVKNLDTVKI